MSIDKTFGSVAISAITTPQTTTPGAKAGMIVEYFQSHNTNYHGVAGQSSGKAALGLKPSETDRNYAGMRKFKEFFSNEEIAACNDGAGLAVGDVVPGVSISSLSSKLPFFAGQQPYERTGLYYSPIIEAGDQPNDRLVDNSDLPHNVAAAWANTSLELVAAPALEPAIA